MQIKVRVFAHLKKYFPSDTEEFRLEIAEGKKLKDLIKITALPAEELNYISILVNGLRGEKEQLLNDGDVVSFVPLFGGG